MKTFTNTLDQAQEKVREFLSVSENPHFKLGYLQTKTAVMITDLWDLHDILEQGTKEPTLADKDNAAERVMARMRHMVQSFRKEETELFSVSANAGE